MTTSGSPCPTLSCRVASLLLAGAFVAFVATQAPHLVHHFFQPALVQDECPFAASGDRTGGLEVEPVAVVVVSEVSTLALAAMPPVPPSAVAAAFLGRAPPISVS
jgi:hypothetical protein